MVIFKKAVGTKTIPFPGIAVELNIQNEELCKNLKIIELS